VDTKAVKLAEPNTRYVTMPHVSRRFPNGDGPAPPPQGFVEQAEFHLGGALGID
jgi:hypothetical protein